MADPLFDADLRRLRRDRAARQGVAAFLLQRAFDDCLERLGDVTRRFDSALLLGCPVPGWKQALQAVADRVTVVDPGPLFAAAAGGIAEDEDRLDCPPGSFDLCLAIGTLDTVDQLPLVLARLRFLLRADSLLIGAMAGHDSLPVLRSAMLAADQAGGLGAAAHVHPRIEASSLGHLLAAAGLVMPVTDVDRVRLAYRSFDALVTDLRAMAATNILVSRPRRPLSRGQRDAARRTFAAAGDNGRTIETIDILHFAAWSPPAP